MNLRRLKAEPLSEFKKLTIGEFLMKNICVISAGGTGQCFAADMSLAGHAVSIYDDRKDRRDEIRQAGGITLTGGGRTGTAHPRVCDSAEQALDGAELVVVCAVAHRHETLAKTCAAHLRDGQTLLISAGSGTSLLFDREIRAARRLSAEQTHDVTLGELEGNLYPCRRTHPARIFMAFPPARRMVAALPAVDTPRLQAALDGILETSPASNVLETALNSPNVVIHLMASLLNLGAVEQSHGEYRLYETGLTPGVLAMLDAMNMEKERLFAAWGWTPRSPMGHMRHVARQDAFPELNAFRSLIGPTDAEHRYLTEDASTCVCLMADTGRLAEVETPLADSLLLLAGALHGRDYAHEGRTLASLGLGTLSKDMVNARLRG